MTKFLAMAAGAAALMIAAPSFAQDKTANSFGAANFEAVSPSGYEAGSYGAPVQRQVRVRASRGFTTIAPQRESGASKRG